MVLVTWSAGGPQLQVEGAAGAKAWSIHMYCSFRNQLGEQCSWYRVRGGDREVQLLI